jgi:hypothetical protein
VSEASTIAEGTAGAGRCRPFSLGDAMILVAAAAGWLWLVSGFIGPLWANLRSLPFGRLSGWSAWWVYLTKTQWGTTATLLVYAHNLWLALLMVSTLACLIMRLRRPRPPLARVALQPGMVACEAELLVFGLDACLAVADLEGSAWMLAASVLPVPLAWGALALTGRWHREPGWIDRLGVWVGIGWCLGDLAFLGFYFAFG